MDLESIPVVHHYRQHVALILRFCIVLTAFCQTNNFETASVHFQESILFQIYSVDWRDLWYERLVSSLETVH